KSADFDVVSNPEFLREGCAVPDLMNPDRVVIGSSSQKATDLMKQVYEPFQAPILVTDVNSAELIKHAANSFLSLKISYINSVAIELINKLVAEGAHVTAYDPKGAEKAVEWKLVDPSKVKIAKTPMDCVDGAEALLLATEWKEFASQDFTEVRKRMHTPLVF